MKVIIFFTCLNLKIRFHHEIQKLQILTKIVQHVLDLKKLSGPFNEQINSWLFNTHYTNTHTLPIDNAPANDTHSQKLCV